INIGMETAHDPTLKHMNKGYYASDILEQLSKLDKAGIRYNIVYLNGLGGKGLGVESATITADVLNKLNPFIVNIVSLTIFPESQLYKELQEGTYVEEPEIERLIEVKTLINNLNIKTNILSNHISNTVPITGVLPNDKAMILRELDKAIAEFPEQELKAYRNRVWHL
ncbi:MAG: radical SAM protein, partial [Muribaculaceae bacterium]|nr:radical SAM protein [Muribaculaceae bacterium]